MGRTRQALADAVLRVRRGAWSIGQCAIAAGVAWAVAVSVLGHPSPFLAVVAAVVCLGTRAAQRLRRVAELAVGVTVGVAVGDVLVARIGTGTLQIALVVGVALLLAVALDGGPLLVAQAGLQAVFVLALPRTPGGELARWQDAMVGGAVALLVAALLPADPWRGARRVGRGVLQEVATTLRTAAAAVRRGDVLDAGDALARSRATQPALSEWVEALSAGRDITRLSPLRRDRDGTFAQQSRLATAVDRATRNGRVLLRRVVAALETGDVLPPALPGLLEELADVLDQLGIDLDGTAAAADLRALGARLDPVALEATGLSGAVVVAQLRSAVVDLLEGTGSTHDQARAALPALS